MFHSRFDIVNRFRANKSPVPPRSNREYFMRVVKAIGRVFFSHRRSIQAYKRLYASSLAFKTLLALVPALAILMAVLSNDTFRPQREQLLDQMVNAIYPAETQTGNTFLDPSEPQNLQRLNQMAKQQIRISIKRFAYHSKKVGIIGFIGFLVVVVLLLRDVETSFNFLWGEEKGRPLHKQFVAHGVFFVGLPVLALFLLTLMQSMVGGPGEGFLSAWLFSSALPFLALWAACSWMYLWFPNTKVEKGPAIWAGLVVTLLLDSTRWAMNWYTYKVVAGSNVYGALWMIPVILLWLYLCWVIILFGAELAHAIQRGGQPA